MLCLMLCLVQFDAWGQRVGSRHRSTVPLHSTWLFNGACWHCWPATSVGMIIVEFVEADLVKASLCFTRLHCKLRLSQLSQLSQGPPCRHIRSHKDGVCSRFESSQCLAVERTSVKTQSTVFIIRVLFLCSLHSKFRNILPSVLRLPLWRVTWFESVSDAFFMIWSRPVKWRTSRCHTTNDERKRWSIATPTRSLSSSEKLQLREFAVCWGCTFAVFVLLWDCWFLEIWLIENNVFVSFYTFKIYRVPMFIYMFIWFYLYVDVMSLLPRSAPRCFPFRVPCLLPLRLGAVAVDGRHRDVALETGPERVREKKRKWNLKGNLSWNLMSSLTREKEWKRRDF